MSGINLVQSLSYRKKSIFKHIMKKKTLFITAAVLAATGIGIYSMAGGKKISLPKRKKGTK